MSKQFGTMTDFHEWVKAQDPMQVYNYWREEDCAVACYFRDRGRTGYCALDKKTRQLENAAQQEHQNPGSLTKLTFGGLRREIEDHFLCPSPSL